MAISDAWDFIWEWWKDYQSDPRADVSNIESGLKKQQVSAEKTPQNIDPAVKGSLQTGACQYWVKGLPSVCKHWKGNEMLCGLDTIDKDVPTGYGEGGCDGLGRRHWCTGYESIDDYDAEQYVCVLPCIERSGAGRIVRESDHIKIVPWNPTEISGYNPTANNVGQCDGSGMGRGAAGFGQEFIENLQLYPAICKQYKPHQLGFGAVDPRPYHGDPTSTIWKDGQTYIPRTPRQLHDGTQADPLVLMDKRLPFAFTVYNLRAKFQKCAHWDSDTGSSFFIDYYGADPSYFNIMIEHEAEGYCKLAGNPEVQPFITIDEKQTDIPYVLWDVWSNAGSIVCNGAKPECPCYTGRWTFCTDRNMQDGMRISADQIFELRFWASNWSSQAEYDAFYTQKPGVTKEGYADVTTADIYTFSKWEKFDATTTSESVMLGNKHHMCMPAPLHMREFDTEAYIEISSITYPKAGVSRGTTGYSDVAFPTLVRELEEPDLLLPDISVIYPYATPDPWVEIPCDLSDRLDICYHNNNLMYEDPRITVVGNCVRRKKVWVINDSYGGDGSSGLSNYDVFSKMKAYPRAQMIPDYEYDSFCASLETAIVSKENTVGAAIVSGETDEYGFFKIDNLALQNNKLNDIYVICEWMVGDFPMYVYRHRKVQSRYFGALISQTNFVHNYQGDVWENHVPKFFSPSGSIEGTVGTVGGEVSEVFPCYSLYKYGIFEDTAYYTYCINSYEEEMEDLEEWVQIGTTGYIWAEIPDINISYLWDFKIITATISAEPLEPYDEINNPHPVYRASLCGIDSENYDDVSFSLVPVEVDEATRKTMPPSAVLLKAVDGSGQQMPRDFFNKDWKLKIKYQYYKLEPLKGENAIFPPGVDAPAGFNRFVESPYSITREPGSPEFKITNIGGIGTSATAAVMAYVIDPEEGRVQAAAATKMLLQGHKLTCRSIDIFYRYGGDAVAFDLEPSSGFFTWRGSPSVATSTTDGCVHSRAAKCGDHECIPTNCIGPVWFPFNDCTTMDFYNVHNGAAQCTLSVSEGDAYIKTMGVGAWRYCMAEEYKGWISIGGNWAAACGSSFYYHYSHADPASMQFTGWAKRRGKIDSLYYLSIGWTLPPFGNTGREMVERWVIRDFVSFLDCSGGGIKSKIEYMPMVLDREDLIGDLDCFANQGVGSHPSLNEPFTHKSQMSNLLADYLGEKIDTTRYRLEDIIESSYHSNCMYPWPALSGFGGVSKVIRYKFKSDSFAWLWPEYWRRIQRGVNGAVFNWLVIERPEYYYDSNKGRHRLISTEGPRKIMFKCPQTQEQTSEEGEGPEDGGSGTYAAISLNGIHWRYFELLYDTYDGTQIKWADESTVGDRGGSGGEGNTDGEDEASIYEEANNGDAQNGIDGANQVQWMHDFDTVFDYDAEPSPSNDRKVLVRQDSITGEDVNAYYNRGLIFKITKDKLHLLPIEATSIPDGEQLSSVGTLGEYCFGPIVLHWEGGEYLTPIEFEICGSWGVAGAINGGEIIRLSQPGVEYGESNTPPVEGEDPPFPSVIYSQAARSGNSISPLDNTKIVPFSMKVELSRVPTRILNKPAYFQLKVFPYGNEAILIDSIKVFGGKYVDGEETIDVWEHKFFVSTLDIGSVSNADGVNSKNYRDYEASGKNAGQYLPSGNTNLSESGSSAISKMTAVSVGRFYDIGDDEIIDVSRNKLKTVEKDEQKFIYQDALALDAYDDLTFSGHYPQDINYFLSEVLGIVGGAGRFHPRGCMLTHKKIDWEHNWYNCNLNQEGEFFFPGGHYFKWSSGYIRTRCYIFGPIETVYETEWVHHLHADGAVESTPTAGESYAGWVRLAYYEGRLASLNALGQTQTEQPTDVLTGAKHGTYRQS